MKILLIWNHAPSLLNFSGDLLREIVSRGHSVHSIAPESSNEIIRNFGASKVNYHPIPMNRTGLNPFSDIRYLSRLIFLVIKLNPDIVICRAIKPNIYGSIAAAIAGKKRIFSIVSGLGYAFMNETLRQRLISIPINYLYRYAFSKNEKVFFQNYDDIALFVKNRLITESKVIKVNGSGVDLDYFAPAPFDSLPPSFILIARLIKDKGIGEFIEAASILKRKHPNAVFRLLGPFDTNPSAIVEEEIMQWHNEGIIEYLGETSDVRPFIKAASVFVLPSYREGTPKSVLEAMSMARPVITTDAPGCRETVVNGENGFIVPVKDAEALAASMEKFILHPELIGKMGKRSREIAVQKYDVKKVNAVIMKTMGLLNEEIV